MIALNDYENQWVSAVTRLTKRDFIHSSFIVLVILDSSGVVAIVQKKMNALF